MSTPSSPTHHKENPSSLTRQQEYPFQAVVVTFPDEGAARVATEGPLCDLAEIYPGTRFLASCDPLGCRCGSGGGTLAALAELEEKEKGDGHSKEDSILILHAGGDSSRCFTQMALGKAWTNIPLYDRDTRQEQLSNPIHLCLDSIARIFSQSHCLPNGSIVIAASDALLSIPHSYYPLHLQPPPEPLGNSSQHDDYPPPDVLGVAFPALWETAQNHGVYVLAEPTTLPNDTRFRLLQVPVRKILQKPSLHELQQQPFVTLGGATTTNTSIPLSQGLAWIDNGIIAFLPTAAQALRQLSKGVLSTTTQKGLLAAYQHRKPSEPHLTYQDVTHKVDLYTHFLQALTIAGEQPQRSMNNQQHRQDYLTIHAADLDLAVANGIFNALSPFQFQALAIAQGKFLHLGTTRELMDFYVYGCKSTELPPVSTRKLWSRRQLYTQNCTYFGQELGMIRRWEVFVNSRKHKPTIGDDCVLMASILETATELSIGEGTVVEFCNLHQPQSSFHIGTNCLVSGLRNGSQATSSIIRIPKDTCVQMMPLQSSHASSFVIMALGVDDPIKKPIAESTFLGIAMETFLQWAGLTPDDVWDPDTTSYTIWNAKLHPILDDENQSFADVWDWIQDLRENTATPPPPSFERWKQQSRLSLSQVRDQSDAAAEFRYRHDLVHQAIPNRRNEYCQEITRILTERRHDECDFTPLLTDTLSTRMNYLSPAAHRAVQTLDSVIVEALLDPKQYDVCGRTLMVQSALLDDLAQAVEQEEESNGASSRIQEQCTSWLKAIQSHATSTEDRQKAFQEIVALREQNLDTNCGALRTTLGQFSEIMESIARVMTEICVSGHLHGNQILRVDQTKRREPVWDQWVISTSPVRVDLAGGWSDTPPICYEFGSMVTGMAVTVDQKKPLSCRCRILTNRDSKDDDAIIFVRSELRDSKSCTITSSQDLQLRSMEDFRDARDPNADGALVKCALVCLGLVRLEMLEQVQDINLQRFVNRFCQCAEGNDVRMEIVVTSLLPQGSGMGTSSILGGCVLAAIGRCVGMEFDDKKDLIDSVSVLEQILSTGGGFQDQVNGLIGGVKTVTSRAGQLPIELVIEPVTVDPVFKKRVDEHLILAFTGKTRLAKNILQNVLRRFARRTPEVVACMQGLVEGAQKASDAFTRGDLEALGQCLLAYYEQKKHMAGVDSGVEPDIVRCLLEMLLSKKLVIGGSLCGAGGGGFLVMLASEGTERTEISHVAEKTISRNDGDQHRAFSWHECRLSNEGLRTDLLAFRGSIDEFHADWHLEAVRMATNQLG
jgi:galactokinase/mevalonate kinase-like predicted kinase